VDLRECLEVLNNVFEPSIALLSVAVNVSVVDKMKVDLEQIVIRVMALPLYETGAAHVLLLRYLARWNSERANLVKL
jgi:hypothetical protein